MQLFPQSLTPDQLVFRPFPEQPDDQYGWMEHHVTIEAEDGTELNGWFFNRGSNKPLVVWYTGKGAHMGEMVLHAGNDQEHSYLLMNYRGYGWSKGIPKESNMVGDARHCLAWCRERIGGYKALYICGYSLGTGVAVQVAAAEHADKLILLAPYDKINTAAVHLSTQATGLPQVLLKVLCGACVGGLLDSTRYAPQVTCPVLIYMAKQETVIPYSSTWNLYHAFTSTHPEVVWVDSLHECILCTNTFWETFWNFISTEPTSDDFRESPWVMVEKGDNYYEGKNGYVCDYDKALDYYRKAAEHDYHWGYFNVGKCYLEGKGVAQNNDEARSWFSKAANQENFWAKVKLAELGDAVMMNEVGDSYYNGTAHDDHTEDADTKAFEWYQKSADAGYHWGYFNVGKCYMEGRGIPQSALEACVWFGKAVAAADNPWALRMMALLGDFEAAKQVSEFYATGSRQNWGMPQDENEAEYFRRLPNGRVIAVEDITAFNLNSVNSIGYDDFESDITLFIKYKDGNFDYASDDDSDIPEKVLKRFREELSKHGWSISKELVDIY